MSPFSRVRRSSMRFLSAGTVFFLLSPSAFAANRYWAGNYANSTQWENAANWSATANGSGGAGIPGAADVAIFTSGTGSETVRIKSAVNIYGLVLASTWSGSIAQGTGTVVIGNDGVKIGSGKLIGGNAAFTVRGAYTQTGGAVTGMMNTLTVTGALSITKHASAIRSTFTSTGTLTMGGKADQAFTIGANVTKSFKNLTINNTGGTTNDDVAFDVSGGLFLSGALTVTLGNMDLATNDVALVVDSGITLADAAQATFNTDQNVTNAGAVSVGDASTITVSAGTWTQNSAADANIDFDDQAVYNLTIANSGSAGSNTESLTGGVAVTNALTVSTGVLDMNSHTVNIDGGVINSATILGDGATITVAGNWDNNGTFTAGTSTVTLDGTSQTLSGSTVFYKLTKTVSSADTLTFRKGTTQRTTNKLTLQGAENNKLSLRSSTAGSTWTIFAELNSYAVSYLDVKDSIATGTINCKDTCTDSGNNTGWAFTTTTTAAADASGGTSTGGGGGGRRLVSPSTSDALDRTTSPADPASPREDGLAVPNKRGLLEVEIEGKAVIFKDVPAREWFASYVWTVIKAGIASGYRDARGRLTGVYGPANPVTYAEIAKMALEAAKKDVSTVSGVPENRTARGQWSEDYIKLAEDIKLSVYEPSLDVNTSATRGAVIQTIVEALNLPLEEGTGGYKDLRASHPHAQAIATATALGIISGDTDRQGNPKGTVRPNDPINRAEVAKILAKVLELGL